MDSSKVLVLVHAFPLGSRMWTEQRSAFRGWTVLAPSRRTLDRATATLDDKFMAERVVVKNGANT